MGGLSFRELEISSTGMATERSEERGWGREAERTASATGNCTQGVVPGQLQSEGSVV